jgi:hypothetical protein
MKGRDLGDINTQGEDVEDAFSFFVHRSKVSSFKGGMLLMLSSLL